MTAQHRFSAIVYAGKQMRAVKIVGPFETAEDVQAWAADNNYPFEEKSDGEWVIAVPFYGRV